MRQLSLFCFACLITFLVCPASGMGRRRNNLNTGIRGLTRNEMDVKFNFVRDWENQQEIVLNDVGSLRNSSFQNGQKTFVLIDGFDSPRTPFYKLLTEAILNSTTFARPNLIIVDYRKLSGRDSWLANSAASFYLYLSVLRNTDIVGLRVADFINFLNKKANISPSDIHVIGMSLGCHVSGAAGISLNKQHGLKLGRITGLDPARTFYPLRLIKRLRSSSGAADFIDSYHTNRGVLGEVYENTGDINVYINGGASQPGCERQDLSPIPYPGRCSHLYVWEFFAATFTKDYLACPCNGWDCYCKKNCPAACASPLKVGVNFSKEAKGSYRVSSTDPAPGDLYNSIKDIFSG